MSEAAYSPSDVASSRVLLLGIDTSGDGDLALAELYADGTLALLARQSLDPRRQSVELFPKLGVLLDSADVSRDAGPSYPGKKIGSLSGIIVVSGPGRFTGLRIGLSAAKGLAHAIGVPVISISALRVLAFGHNETVAVMYAGRDAYFVRLPNGVESLESEASVQVCIAGRPVVTAQAEMESKLAPGNGVTVVKAGAFAAIRAALTQFTAGEFEDIAMLDANYVRKPYTDRAAGTAPA